jgi:hypothetical protein
VHLPKVADDFEGAGNSCLKQKFKGASGGEKMLEPWSTPTCDS